MSTDTRVDEFLMRWFQQQLDAADADFSREALSYDGNSEYDHLCYQLVSEAERLCRLRFGHAPSGCALQRALAGAEFSRARHKRLNRPMLIRLRDWFKKQTSRKAR